jgi:hypothetical protein
VDSVPETVEFVFAFGGFATLRSPIVLALMITLAEQS